MEAMIEQMSTRLGRWSADEARVWYGQQKWLVGANYLPANAINELEMWQAETFDPARIETELAWAETIGINTMRVFLHDALWRHDAAAFKSRIEMFLGIAAGHGIKPMLVLFDSCWDPEPKLGPQRPPIPGVHNSGWVQAPGRAILDDPSQHCLLKAYVEDIVGTFAGDPRVLCWDVWNEPDNGGGGNYADYAHAEPVALLLPQVFAWARSLQPIQPLTSGVWRGSDWSIAANLSPIQKTQLEQSDIVSFHNYDWPEAFEARVRELETYGRPIICTEYLARSAGSTLDTVLPLGKELNVGMINWGFVNGRSQTDLPWDSWLRPYTQHKPTVWFHDLLHADGTPYRARELELIRTLVAAPRRAQTVAPAPKRAANDELDFRAKA